MEDRLLLFQDETEISIYTQLNCHQSMGTY